MDIDRFIVANTPTWERLTVLTRRATPRAARLSAPELDELLHLYQRVSTHLSYARTNFGDPGLTHRLTRLVASTGGVIYGTRPRSLRAAGQFFTRSFPAALWHVRPFLVASALLTFAPAAAAAAWLMNSHRSLDLVAPAAKRAAYVRAENGYYSAQPSAQFATQVFTNNIRVAIVAFASGILVCGFTAYVLVNNGVSIGVVIAVFSDAGQEAHLWGLLLPHGLIELTSVVIAGAAGLRLGWTIIDPGDRPRLTALGEEGRRAVVLVFGVMFTLAVAGTIEGFVTGSPLPTGVRVGIGVLVEVAFLSYAWVFGRQAAAAGYTGALGEGETGWRRSSRFERPPVATPIGT